MPFNPRDLAMALGSLGSLRGSPAGAAFAQTWQALEQQKRQRELQQQQMQMQQEDRTFARQNVAADNARADAASQTAAREQRMRFVQGLPVFLGDEGIETPEAFDQRFGVASRLGGEIGVEPGFLETFRPTSDKFTQRKAKKVVARIENDKRFAQHLANPEFGAQLFEDGGERRSYSEWKQIAGQGGPAAGSPALPVKTGTGSNTPEEEYIAAYAKRLKKTPDALTDAERLEAKKKWMQADDRPRVDPNAPTATGALPPRTQRLVDAQSKGFDAQPIVKTTQKMAEAVSFAQGLDPNTTNPADDQALIYAFAKAMDPDSVVREGEYATVQKYAQSWAEKFGFDAARIFSNTHFLTPEARANMKATITERYKAGRSQYDNVRKSYAHRINRITGQQDGDTHLIDYAGAFPDVAVGPSPRTPTKNPFRR